MAKITSPYAQLFDSDGSPLDSGSVYLGVSGQNPITNPINVYWDSALTIPAAQPLRTLNGYLMHGNSPAQAFVVETSFSIVVQNRAGALIYSDLLGENVQLSTSEVSALISAAQQSGAATLLTNVLGVDTITAEAVPARTTQVAVGSLWKLPSAGVNTVPGVTLNIDAMGAVAVVRPDGSALAAGDIGAAGYIALVEKRAADFVLLNPVKLEQTQAQLQAGIAYTSSTGAVAGENYVLTPNPVLAANVENASFMIEFHTAPVGACDLAVSGLAAVAMRYRNSAGTKTAFAGAEFPAGWRSRVVHDGANWVVLDMPTAATPNGDYQVFPGNGTWNAPGNLTGDELVLVELWGGGGGGAGTANTGGGGGGAYQWAIFTIDVTTSSRAITVGAGGASGVAGGNSSFGALVTAYGGGPGNATNGGGGGGSSGAGSATAGGTGYGASAAATLGDSTAPDAGAGNRTSSGKGYSSTNGGAGGGFGAAGDGGSSLYGGGGGGSTGRLAGPSLFGGNGGSGGSPTGSAPGGGGGVGGPGARGEVRVRVLR